MSLESMAFILGGILIAAGLFGGGLEIKEIRLPQIGGTTRILTTVAGAIFVVLALAIHLKWIQRTETADAPDIAAAPEQTFAAPMFDGMRLDICVEWAVRCGEEAATAWCRTQGYARASDYPAENVGTRGIPTRLIGTRQVCNGEYCGAFTRITCVR